MPRQDIRPLRIRCDAERFALTVILHCPHRGHNRLRWHQRSVRRFPLIPQHNIISRLRNKPPRQPITFKLKRKTAYYPQPTVFSNITSMLFYKNQLLVPIRQNRLLP